MLYFKSIEPLQITDIEFLKNEGITEGRFLDYKEQPPTQDARGLLETAVAFANSQGRVIVYGVKELRAGNEKIGKIAEIGGFETASLDSLKSRIENQLRDQVQRRLEYRMKDFILPNGKYLLLLRVNQGWQGPYFYRAQKGLFFYRRAESQNIQMSHPEIRESFLVGETVRDKLSNFPEKRVQSIISQQMPFNMDGELILIAHILPLDSFRGDLLVPQSSLSKFASSVGPLAGSGYSARPNIDGIFQYWSRGQDDHSKPASYVQFFRNGAIEYADSYLLRNNAKESEMFIKPFGDRLAPASRRAISYQKNLGFHGPFYLGVSLWNVKGTKVTQSSDGWATSDDMRFDREHIHLPLYEIVL